MEGLLREFKKASMLPPMNVLKKVAAQKTFRIYLMIRRSMSFLHEKYLWPPVLKEGQQESRHETPWYDL